MNATRLWSLWQALILSLALGFSQPGKRRFVEWTTGLALNVEEHTITQSLIGLDRAGLEGPGVLRGVRILESPLSPVESGASP